MSRGKVGAVVALLAIAAGLGTLWITGGPRACLEGEGSPSRSQDDEKGTGNARFHPSEDRLPYPWRTYDSFDEKTDVRLSADDVSAGDSPVLVTLVVAEQALLARCCILNATIEKHIVILSGELAIKDGSGELVLAQSICNSGRIIAPADYISVDVAISESQHRGLRGRDVAAEWTSKTVVFDQDGDLGSSTGYGK